MKGQFSRLTERRARRYSSVRQQQGRVQLDADHNEQVEIDLRRDRLTTRDVVGPAGRPLEEGGFGLRPVTTVTALSGAGASLRAVGARGTALASADGGATWTAQPLPAASPALEHDLLAVHVLDATHALATTAAGEVLLQADGATWPTSAPADAAGAALRGAQLLSATAAWVVGDGGRILGTADGGATWVRRTAAGVTGALRALHFPTATAGWAVGDAGAIVHTADGGATWAAQPNPVSGGTTRLHAVRFASDALHGWAVGDGATILSTADGGATWVRRPAPGGVDATLRALDAVSTATAWAAGDRGAVLRTTDGGATWAVVAPSAEASGADLAALRASSAADAIVGGSGSVLAAVSISGGLPAWQPSPALPGRELEVGAGRLYVDGVLVENEHAARYLAQPDLPGATLPAAGTYRAYLDVWQRHLTALDRPELREVALGGPDTTTRTQTVWQVRIDAAGGLPASTSCAAIPAGWRPVAAGDARLRARGAPTPATANDCLVPAGGGYRRLENQLYRVEIRGPGAPGTATYAWSRENGSITAGLLATDPAPTAMTVSVDDPGHGPGDDFAGAAWIELTDDRRLLNGEAGVFLPVLGVTGSVIRVTQAPPAMAAFGPGAIVRRWDGTGTVPAAGWVALATADGATGEDGVEVEFAGTAFATGDHWAIPARTLTGDVEWPRDAGAPRFLEPDGVEHRYAALAIVTVDAGGGLTVAEDCRVAFPPLGGVDTLVYVSGDGQEVLPGGSLQLPDAAVVGVVRGPVPVRGARVRFRAADGGTLAGTLAAGGAVTGVTEAIVATGPDGLASVAWTLAAGTAPQHLAAELLDATDARRGTPLGFSARVRSAASIGYEPGCADLAGVATVQDALDALCRRPSGGGGGCCHTVGRTADESGEFAELNEALQVLVLERGHRNVCLCLLPGDHRLDPGLVQLVMEKNPPETLEIGGVGARLLLDARIEVGGGTHVTLRELEVVAGEGGAFAFAGDPAAAAEDRMAVDLLDLAVTAGGMPPEGALVSFASCGRVAVSRCRLAATGRPSIGLADAFGPRVGRLLDLAADPGTVTQKVADFLAKLLDQPDADRADFAAQALRALDLVDALRQPPIAASVKRLAELLRAGAAALPGAPGIEKLRVEWRRIAGAVAAAGGDGGSPSAIHLPVTSAEVRIDGNRITGAITLVDTGRDAAAEVKAESPFRVHDVQEVPDGDGRLRIERNTLDTISLGATGARRLAETNGDVGAAELRPALFAEVVVAGNAFTSAPHVVLGTAITVHGNVFETAVRGDAAPRLGFVASLVASATGNLGPDRRPLGSDRNAELVVHGSDRAEAGNARLTIV